MPLFIYQARTVRGDRVSGTLEAASEIALDDTLRTRGLVATHVKMAPAQARKQTAAASAAAPGPTGRLSLRLRERELAIFSMHLATVLKSGLPLSMGLRNSAEDGTSKRIQAVATALLQRVEAGQMLSDAMSEMPEAFPDFYVNLIKAGEAVGHVDEVLLELVTAIEWQMNLKSDIKQAATYPILLLSLLFILTLGIAIFVMPRLVGALSRTGVELPTSAKVVVAFGVFVQTNWMQVLVGIAAVVAGVRLAFDTPRGRYLKDVMKLKAPLLGTLVRQVALSRFAHHLRMMVRAGVNFVVALNVVEHVVGNRVLAAAIAGAREKVIAGATLAEALKETKQFTPLVIQMVSTGEVTGSLDETLKKVTEYYDREVPATVKRISTAVEPIVYVVLGVVVLSVAMMLYSPLLNMLGQINTRPRF